MATTSSLLKSARKSAILAFSGSNLLLISAILRLTCSCTSLGLCHCARVRQAIGRSVSPLAALVM
jgi:hypothetical protein